MSNPLDPIYEAAENARGAIKVVRRCSRLKSIDERRPFGHTPFEGLQTENVLDRLEEADEEIEDLIVLALYATFERTLREHIKISGNLLASAQPPVGLGDALSAWFAERAEEFRMDVIAGWFCPPVKPRTHSKISKIRLYRHWVAHGRNPSNQPELVTAAEAYSVLTTFLQEAGLI